MEKEELTKIKLVYFHLVVNVYIIGFILLFVLLIGVSCNLIAIKNNYKMPVYNWKYDLSEVKFHFAYTNFSQVEYPYLTDIIPIADGIFSIGDLLIFLSLSFSCSYFITLAYYYFRYKLKYKIEKQIIWKNNKI